MRHFFRPIRARSIVRDERGGVKATLPVP
ncbi:hypothetical protein IL54_2415 [Sphingobium sp. ba1]|nr:hypothetical protein IL54_2415 [Sphingobium sp. ba1]